LQHAWTDSLPHFFLSSPPSLAYKLDFLFLGSTFPRIKTFFSSIFRRRKPFRFLYLPRATGGNAFPLLACLDRLKELRFFPFPCSLKDSGHLPSPPERDKKIDDLCPLFLPTPQLKMITVFPPFIWPPESDGRRCCDVDKSQLLRPLALIYAMALVRFRQ